MTRITHRHDRNAFTLIELVAALTLATIMMVALLRIVATVSLESAQLRRQNIDRNAAQILAQRIHDDVINARGIQFDAKNMVLGGYATGSKLPGLVSYETRNAAGQAILVRREGDVSELMWVGFGGFLIEPLEFADEDAGDVTSSGGLSSVPGKLRIAILDDVGRTLSREVILHHAL